MRRSERFRWIKASSIFSESRLEFMNSKQQSRQWQHDVMLFQNPPDCCFLVQSRAIVHKSLLVVLVKFRHLENGPCILSLKLTSIDVKFLSSFPCFVSSSGYKRISRHDNSCRYSSNVMHMSSGRVVFFAKPVKCSSIWYCVTSATRLQSIFLALKPYS